MCLEEVNSSLNIDFKIQTRRSRRYLSRIKFHNQFLRIYLSRIKFHFLKDIYHKYNSEPPNCTHGILAERLDTLSSLTRSEVRPLSSSAAGFLGSTCHPVCKVRKEISLGRSGYPWFY